MPEKLPAVPTSDVAAAEIHGQLALMDDPRQLAELSLPALKLFAAEAVRRGLPVMDTLRRGYGLICWAMRRQMAEGEYGKWTLAYAESLGVSPRTLGRWRATAERTFDLGHAHSTDRPSVGQDVQREALPAVLPSDSVADETTGAGFEEVADAQTDDRGREGGSPEGSTDDRGRTDDGPAHEVGADRADPGSGETGRGSRRGVQRPVPRGDAVPPGDDGTGRGRVVTGPAPRLSDRDLLAALDSRTDDEIVAIGDPWGPGIRAQIERWARTLGIMAFDPERVRQVMEEAAISHRGVRGIAIPEPSKAQREAIAASTRRPKPVVTAGKRLARTEVEPRFKKGAKK